MPSDDTPPQDLDAEQQLLAACLESRDCLETARGVVKSRDFRYTDHGYLFDLMGDMARDGMALTLKAVDLELHRLGRNERYPADFLHVLASFHHMARANVDYYARRVRDTSMMRDLIEAGNRIAELGDQEDVYEAAAQAEKLVHDAVDRMVSPVVSQRELLNDLWEDIERRQDNPGTISSLSTGFPVLDRMTGGIEPGALVIIGSRPGMGKTVIGLNMAVHAARHCGPVLFFSLEMTRREIGRRMIAAESRTNTRLARTGDLPDADWTKVGRAFSIAQDWPISWDDSSALTVPMMKSRARQASRGGRLALVVIDYLQLVRATGKRENRTQEVGSVVRDIKGMARDLDTVVVALAQLNRNADQHAVPTMGDLRESGEIEAAADLILLLHQLDTPENVDAITAKNRNGDTHKVPLRFTREWSRFDERADGREP